MGAPAPETKTTLPSAPAVTTVVAPPQYVTAPMSIPTTAVPIQAYAPVQAQPMMMAQPMMQPTQAMAAFNALDRNGDGVISAAEFMQAQGRAQPMMQPMMQPTAPVAYTGQPMMQPMGQPYMQQY